MNKNHKSFIDFFYRLVNSMTTYPYKTKKNVYSQSIMDSYTEELRDFFVNEKQKNSKTLSFFTLDQQLEPFQYRPQNQDLNKNYEFVFSGCSQTHGDHISKPLVKNGDHKNIWGFQIAKDYNKEALNLGMGGWGAESVLKGLMHHFQKNGNPKVLLVLYPDLGRMESIDSNKIRMKTKLNDVELVQHWFLFPESYEKEQKISTIPHDPSDVIPFTHAVYKNLQSILILNEYCKQNNIYFKYTSWDFSTNIILKALKKLLPEYSNYSEPETINFEKYEFEKLKCHQEIKTIFSDTIWNSGSDNHHMGIHQHIHVAEQFKKEIKNDNPWN